MNTARVLALTFLPVLPTFAFAASSAFTLAGVIRVTMIWSRFSARHRQIHGIGETLAAHRLTGARTS